MADVERVKGNEVGREPGVANIFPLVARLTISIEYTPSLPIGDGHDITGCILDETRVKFGLRFTISGRLRFSSLFASLRSGLTSEVIFEPFVPFERFKPVCLDMFIMLLEIMPSVIVPLGLLDRLVSTVCEWSESTPLCRLEL